MNSPRFYSPFPLAAGARVELAESAARHAVRVLRLGAGDALTLFDGNGGEYACRIAACGRDTASVEVLAWQDVERESPLALTLVQALQAGEKMDLTVQKAVELGAARIAPVVSRRSVVRLEGERARKRVAHWRAVAVSACEQCGRNRVPLVHAPQSLADWLRGADASGADAARFLLSLREGHQPLRLAASDARSAWVLHGPEGGLTAQEEDWALERGWQPASLGVRVLRAETASVAALSVLALD